MLGFIQELLGGDHLLDRLTVRSQIKPDVFVFFARASRLSNRSIS
jgi:hypothetical protein